MSLPIVAAIALARSQVRQFELAQTTHFARDALNAVERTTAQLDSASRAVNRLPLDPACPPAERRTLAAIDLSQSLLQAVGIVADNTIICSSIGGSEPIRLGPPDFTTLHGAQVWRNAHIFDSDVNFLVVVEGRFAGIVHKQIGLAASGQQVQATVGVFNWSHRRLLLQRGTIAQHLIDDPNLATGARLENGMVIAIVQSQRYDLGVIVVAPVSAVGSGLAGLNLLVVPIGALSGLVLSVWLLWLIRETKSIPAQIRAGIRRREFHLVYQPMIDLDHRRVIGAEVLVRWRRRGGQDMSPDTFIPAAEASGSIRLITDHVLDLLATEARVIKAAHPHFNFGVNISAADIHADGFVARMIDFSDRAGLQPTDLVIELTERSFIDSGLSKRAIDSLRARGVRFAIDDFGTGFCNLGYLAQNEVDYLKIDKLFVQALGSRSALNQVAFHIVDIARDLGLEVIAEGVETATQVDNLYALGVRHAQGYRFAVPLALDGLLDYLARAKAPLAAVA